MDLLVDSILIGLAGWRIGHMLVSEDGPALIFERLRTTVGANEPGKVSGFLPTLFSCIYCMSVWTSIFAYGLWQLEPIIVAIVASMSIALIVNKLARPDN